MNSNVLYNVTAVIRTYSNNFAAKNTVEKLLEDGLGHVVLVVRYENAEDLKNYNTYFKSFGTRKLTIVALQAEEYSWTTALNRGALAAIQRSDCYMILNVSVEAAPNPAYLIDAATHLLGNDEDGVIYFPFDDVSDVNGDPLELGLTYQVPRNTCMLVNVDCFAKVPGFSIICDGFGGMEDFLFCLQLAHQCVGIHCQPLRESLEGPIVQLKVNKNQAGQQEKEEREMKAIKLGVTWLKKQCGLTQQHIIEACQEIGVPESLITAVT